MKSSLPFQHMIEKYLIGIYEPQRSKADSCNSESPTLSFIPQRIFLNLLGKETQTASAPNDLTTIYHSHFLEGPT